MCEPTNEARIPCRLFYHMQVFVLRLVLLQPFVLLL